MQENHISFRAPSDLVEALNSAAERDGVSQSEIIRRALQDRFVRDEPSQGLPFDPFGKIAAAARGDIAAQRALANEAVRRVMFESDDVDPIIALSEGLVFARMAASQGDIADQGLCISMLALMVQHGDEDSCRDQIAEAAARVALVADAGDEYAAAQLPALMEMLPSGVIPYVKHYEQRLHDGEAA